MARMPRLAVAGQPHLVIQRSGVQAAFLDNEDRHVYLESLREVSRGGIADVHAYALLDDGVLLLVSPREAADLGRLMQRVNRRYVAAFHRRHGGSGALWGGRFQAAALEPERYLLRCISMIEQAPVRAGIVTLATEWQWSSARHHSGLGTSPILTEHDAWWRTGNTPFEREAKHEVGLQRGLRDDEFNELLNAARGGWPLGSADFVSAVEKSSHRTARPRPRGRPRLNKVAI